MAGPRLARRLAGPGVDLQHVTRHRRAHGDAVEVHLHLLQLRAGLRQGRLRELQARAGGPREHLAAHDLLLAHGARVGKAANLGELVVGLRRHRLGLGHARFGHAHRRLARRDLRRERPLVEREERRAGFDALPDLDVNAADDPRERRGHRDVLRARLDQPGAGDGIGKRRLGGLRERCGDG